MTADPKFSRRALLASGVALSTAIAGCSGGDDGSSTPSQSGNTTVTAEETPTSTEAGTTDPMPSLSEFDYPEGARQDGIDNAALYSTHESTVTDAGSITFTLEQTSTFDGDEFTTTTTNQFSSGDIYREIEEDSRTEFVWSPSGDDQSYVQMESGFDTHYRIDNESPSSNAVTGLQETRRTLENGDWEAVEVVESDDGFAVIYEGTGNDSVNSNPDRESSEGTFTLEDSGYVSEVDYSITYTDSTLEATGTVSSLSETTAEAPSWLDTAKEDGTQFTIEQTSSGTTYRLEMVNGDEIPSEARVSLRDNSGRGESALPSALSVGDSLYVGLSESSELLVDTEEAPTDARALGNDPGLAIREGSFDIFVHE